MGSWDITCVLRERGAEERGLTVWGRTGACGTPRAHYDELLLVAAGVLQQMSSGEYSVGVSWSEQERAPV